MIDHLIHTRLRAWEMHATCCGVSYPLTHNRCYVAVPAALSSARMDGVYIGLNRHRQGQYIALQSINTVSLFYGGSGQK